MKEERKGTHIKQDLMELPDIFAHYTRKNAQYLFKTALGMVFPTHLIDKLLLLISNNN
jgi:hypothetical protein